MNLAEYQTFINSIKPNPAHMDIIKNVCDDLDVFQCKMEPYHLKLWKLGKKDLHIMCVTLTMGTGHEWEMGLSISEVYNKIKNHFK